VVVVVLKWRGRRIGSRTFRAKLIWHSAVKITEVWPVAVLGPLRMKKFGKEEMHVP
jgi:hypothetical protein